MPPITCENCRAPLVASVRRGAGSRDPGTSAGRPQPDASLLTESLVLVPPDNKTQPQVQDAWQAASLQPTSLHEQLRTRVIDHLMEHPLPPPPPLAPIAHPSDPTPRPATALPPARRRERRGFRAEEMRTASAGADISGGTATGRANSARMQGTHAKLARTLVRSLAQKTRRSKRA